jgi:glucokinase
MLLGLDVSEARCAVILADENGKTQVALRAGMPRLGSAPARWLAAMDVARQAMLQTHVVASQIVSTCIAFHAPLDANGVVLKDSRAPAWAGYDLKRALREHLHLESVSAASRVLCEAIAEERLGALRSDVESMLDSAWLYLHLGVTVEAAARSSGVLVGGGAHAGMDIGAVCIERGGALSDSGRRGSLDAYCGGEAFMTRARSYSLNTSTPHEIWEMAASNAMAKSLCDDYTERLAQGVGAALSLLNPQRLVIGGELGHELGERLLTPLRARLGEYCLPRHLANLQIENGQLGPDAAVLGAVSLARQPLP